MVSSSWMGVGYAVEGMVQEVEAEGSVSVSNSVLVRSQSRRVRSRRSLALRLRLASRAWVSGFMSVWVILDMIF